LACTDVAAIAMSSFRLIAGYAYPRASFFEKHPFALQGFSHHV
jgi:hypothetical protein